MSGIDYYTRMVKRILTFINPILRYDINRPTSRLNVFLRNPCPLQATHSFWNSKLFIIYRYNSCQILSATYKFTDIDRKSMLTFCLRFTQRITSGWSDVVSRLYWQLNVTNDVVTKALLEPRGFTFYRETFTVFTIAVTPRNKSKVTTFLREG